MKDKVLFLPGLNGLRSIASLSVMIGHIAGSSSAFNLDFFLFGSDEKGLPKSWLLGSYGVTIFFVLSGFLITYLLVLEKEKSEINIKKFYIRRILRIWPIYYLFFIVCLAVIFYTQQSISYQTVLYYIFFLANIPFIYSFSIPLVSHYWSIAVEEQFYLFWPLLLKNIKNLFLIVFSLVLIQNIIRYFLWWQYPYLEGAIFSIVNRFDCMMIGGIAAILYYKKHTLFMKLCDNKLAQFISWFLIILLACNVKFVNAIIDTTIVTLFSVVLIVGQINVKNRLVNLDIPFFNFIGKISYGIYVYHILIIYLFSNLYSNLILNSIYKTWLVYGSVILMSIFVAYISYEYFESYFIKFKDKFAVVKSSASKPIN